MKHFILFIFTMLLVSCVQPQGRYKVKQKPEFVGQQMDPELKVIVDEFHTLSASNDLHFGKSVSIGFSDIKKSTVIGTCTMREDFREVDLDKDYWDGASPQTKTALVFHELTHCYCSRDHDFGNGTMYPDSSLKYILQKLFSKVRFSPAKPEGYLDDGCPESIMAPVIISDSCFETHFEHYVKEMFNRCEPYK